MPAKTVRYSVFAFSSSLNISAELLSLTFTVPSISPSHALTQVSEFCCSGSWKAPGFHQITLESLLEQVSLGFRKHYKFVFFLGVFFSS